uniref:Uncharacterized protein n=1 Tax=Anopheles arabiensis TaxID=7173 RepID=A0A182IFD2_ANOAR
MSLLDDRRASGVTDTSQLFQGGLGRLAPPAASTDSVGGGHTAATSNTTATTVATSSSSGGPTIDPSTASLRSSSSRQGSVDGVMQRCGLCSIISSLLRRAMCVGSRRGSGESYYQELAETNELVSSRIDETLDGWISVAISVGVVVVIRDRISAKAATHATFTRDDHIGERSSDQFESTVSRWWRCISAGCTVDS